MQQHGLADQEILTLRREKVRTFGFEGLTQSNNLDSRAVSDDQHRGETAAWRPEIRCLALVEARGHEQELAIIGVEPHVHFA